MTYIDPGSGSLIIQAVLGFLAGALVGLKIFWVRLATWFKTRFNKSQE